MKIREDVRKEFGKRLQKLRREKGISQVKLAEQLEIHFMTVSRWELGHFSPSFDQLIFLAEFFEVSIDYLMGIHSSANIVTPHGNN